MKKPVVLIVMDGVGLAEPGEGNAVRLAKTPNLDRLFEQYPHTTLKASGEAVGLPGGQMGNSEVGHLNIGAGRIVYQSLTRVHRAIADKSFYKNEAYLSAIEHAKKNEGTLHVMGLLSDGGVHSHISHFEAMLDLAKMHDVKRLVVHAFLDGRDVGPKSAIPFIERLQNHMKAIALGEIKSVHGRYYAMDRDRNWERIQKSYDVLVHGKGKTESDAVSGIEASYRDDVGDEFVVPFAIGEAKTIEDGDSVVFMNFRPDRAIQLSTVLTNPPRAGITSAKRFNDLCFVCTMHYSENVKGKIAFELQPLDNLFGDVVSENGLKQLRIAETEKYAHVTFFFDGGKDKTIPGSTRVLIDSPKVATYDMKPEMSAHEVTARVLEELEKNIHDVIILNYANGDMVGHTGVIEAAVKAVETVDACVGKVVAKTLERGGVALVSADHGNAENMLDETGNPVTAHTPNDVPMIVTDHDIRLRGNGILGDIAPTMLDYLGLEKPQEMSGVSLIIKDEDEKTPEQGE